MAFIQKKTPPPNKILTFSLRDFSGGLNNRSHQLLVNEASDLLNMKFSDDTLMEKRNGQEYYDDVDLKNPITFMHQFKPYTENDKLVKATDTKLYMDNVEVATLAGRCDAVNFQGKYFFVDGDKIRVYGKFPQETTTYEVVVGTPNPNYVVMEVVNPPSDYTPLDTTHTKGVTKYDYTNKKVWYEPCELEIEDAYKGKNVLPEKPKYIVNHSGRLFLSGSSKDNDNVFISDVHNPYYFPVSLPIQIPPDSDMVKGLAVFDDAVVIGRENDVYVISGITNRPDVGLDVFRLRKLNTHTGFASNNLVNVAHNYLFFVGSDGNAYSLGSSKYDEKNLATVILSKTIDIEKYPIEVSLKSLSDAYSIFYKDEWYIFVEDKVLIYSYRHRAWTLFNNFSGRSAIVLDDELVWGDASGRTVKFSADYLDFGKPFEAFWKSKRFDMDDASAYKMFREFFLVAHTYEDYFSDINVTFEIDYADVQGRQVVSNQISIFGRAVWGDRFINRYIAESLPFVIGRRGRSIAFKFSNGYFPSGLIVATKADLYKVLGKRDGLLVWVTAENKYYLYYNYAWEPMESADLNQGMKIYQVNGDYEMRGKR